MAKSKSKALAKNKSKGLVVSSWEDEMSKYAQEIEETETSGDGDLYLSTSGAEFSLGDNELGDTIEVVVLDYIYDSAYYEEDYSPDNPQTPICFALGKLEKELVPHEKCESPQASSCADCELGQFIDDEVPECTHKQRLAVVPVGKQGEIDSNNEIAFLRIPPGSMKFWRSYVKRNQKVLGLPPMGVVTELSIHKNKGGVGFKVKPTMVGEIESAEAQNAVLKLRQMLGDSLFTPYQKIEDDDVAPVKKRGKKKSSKKRVSKKKASKKRASKKAAVKKSSKPRRKF